MIVPASGVCSITGRQDRPVTVFEKFVNGGMVVVDALSIDRFTG